MDITGSYTFAAAPDAVWKLLTDPDVIAGCLPGCDRLESIGDDQYRAVLALAVGPVSGRYTGTVSMLDKDPPHSYRLVVEGRGTPGFVNGAATIDLVSEGNGTTVRVTGRGEVGGLMARVGQRMLGSVSKLMMDRFFECLHRRL